MTQPATALPQLLVLNPLRPAQMAQLAQSFTLHQLNKSDDQAAILANVGAGIRGVVTSGAVGFKAAMLPLLPALEIVASSGVGTDSIDIDACHARGVAVTNTPDVLNDDVADLGVGLILNALRRLGDGHSYTRNGEWASRGMMPLTTSLKDKRLGIVGLGRIGHELANRASALKMRIAYTGRTRQDVPHTYYDSLTELAHNSDVLALTCPGGKQTHHLINSAILAALGPKGWIINLARGTVIDEAALISALEHRTIGGAALDVFDNEPNIDPRFLTLDNVVLYPHHASGTVETRNAMSQLVVDNLVAHFQQRPLLTPV